MKPNCRRNIVESFEHLEPRKHLAADLPALADAYVRDGTYASTNYGAAPELVVKKSGTTGNSREAYLRFNIAGTSIGAGQAVKLRLYGALGDTRDPSVGVALHPVTNTSWAEGGLTWTGKPTVGAALRTTTVSGTAAQWYEWDVTNYVIDEKTNGQTDVAFALRAPTTHDPLVLFNAEEASGNDPVLAITDATTPPPPPPTGQKPYKGAPFAVGGTPVTIQAEDYDLGGQGVAFNDTTATNLGGAYRPNDGVDLKPIGTSTNTFRTSDAVAGEWMEYTIDVATAGSYELEFRVGHTNANARFHAEVDGADVTGSLLVPDTNSFNTLTSVKKTVTLAAGTHVLRFAHDVNASTNTAASFDWVKISPAATQQPPPASTTTTNIPINDAAYVRGGTYASQNFGSAADLSVKKNADASFVRETFLRINLSSVANITAAKLRLYGGLSSASSAGVNVGVYAISDGWVEGGITFGNRPTTTAAALVSKTITSTTKVWHEFDLTSFLKAEKAAGRNVVSLVLKAAANTEPAVNFHSENATSNRPEVVVTSSPSTSSGRPVTVGVNLADPVQTIDGFGSAMISWIPRNPDAPLRVEYEDPAFYDKIAGDLGASMARIPIWPAFEIANDNDDPDTFNWDGFDPAALGRTLTFLQRLKDRGVTRFVATVWTPPQWMKTTGSAFDGGMLRPDLREEFAEYIAAFAIVARDEYGITMTGISLQNEPHFVTSYESMIVTPEQFRELAKTVRAKLDREGLGAVKLIMPEDVNSNDRYDWFMGPTLADPAARDAVDVVAAHGTQTDYWNAMGPLIDKYRTQYGKSFWLTEASGHAATWAGALTMGTHMYDALVRGDASAYLYWQWSEDAGDSEFALMVDGQPTVKYHVAKHFYRYIRPGAVRVGATSSDGGLKVASFKHPTSGAVTHVLINTAATAADVTLNLGGAGAAGAYKQYRTSGGENHVRLADVAGGSAVKVNLPASSIVTLYSGADLTGGTAASGGPLPAVKRIDTAPLAAYDAALSSALRTAVMKGQLATVQSLIAGGADVNDASDAGWTALHVAASSPYANSVAIINALLDAGAGVTKVTNTGWTPLHVAAANGTTANGTSSTLARDKVNALLAGGASSIINARDDDGRTALHWAGYVTKQNLSSRTEDATVVSALLTGGANKTLLDDFGKTPRDYALAEGNAAAATALA